MGVRGTELTVETELDDPVWASALAASPMAIAASPMAIAASPMSRKAATNPRLTANKPDIDVLTLCLLSIVVPFA